MTKKNSFIDISGKKFGKLVALNYINSGKWIFLCECGQQKTLYRWNAARAGSCGCLSKKHGMSGKGGLDGKAYQSWENMKSRCLNKNNPSFHRYGGRGIKVCNEWLDFKNFFKDMGSPPSLKHSIDRINNDLGYSKENCRWTTAKEQNRNHSRNIMICLEKETKCLLEWCEIKKLNYDKLYHKIYRLKLNPTEVLKEEINNTVYFENVVCKEFEQLNK